MAESADPDRGRAAFVAIEGIDGAGKSTLTKALLDRAADAGLKAAHLTFPRYRQTAFGQLIGRYLNGRYGDLDTVSPYFSGLLFAGDRYESRTELTGALQQNDLLIVDRYVASNIAYQAVRLAEADRNRFIERLSEIEHDVFGLPQPALYLLIDMPASAAGALMDGRKRRDYTERSRDLHEADADFLGTVAQMYRRLASAGFGAPWQVIDPVGADGALRPPQDIAVQAWAGITRVLE